MNQQWTMGTWFYLGHNIICYLDLENIVNSIHTCILDLVNYAFNKLSKCLKTCAVLPELVNNCHKLLLLFLLVGVIFQLLEGGHSPACNKLVVCSSCSSLHNTDGWPLQLLKLTCYSFVTWLHTPHYNTPPIPAHKHLAKSLWTMPSFSH